MTESLLVIRGFIWSAKGFIAHEQINHSLHVPVDVIKLHRIVCSDHSGLGLQTEVVDKEAHRKGKRGPAEDCQELPRDATGAEGTGEKAAKIWSMKCRIVEVNVAPPIGLFDLVGLSSRPIPCKAIGTNRGIQQWTDAALSISVTSLDQFWSIKLKAPPPARSLNSP